MNASSRLAVPSMRDHVSAEEWQTRCDLAACYRLVAHFGWSDLVFTHITARVPGHVRGSRADSDLRRAGRHGAAPGIRCHQVTGRAVGLARAVAAGAVTRHVLRELRVTRSRAGYGSGPL